MRRITEVVWQSPLLLTLPGDRHYYRVILRQDEESTGTGTSWIDVEIWHINDELDNTPEWQPVERFSALYGKILQYALLSIKQKGEA